MYDTVSMVKERISPVKCLEKELLEGGLMSEFYYKKYFTGKNANRSETRLYDLYEAVGTVLKLVGKKDVVSQGGESIFKKNLTLRYTGNVYGNLVAALQVSPDLMYRNPDDSENVIRCIEVRASSNNLAKNIYNNVRSLTGESYHFNHIVSTSSKLVDNYFTSVTFIDKNNVDFDRVVSSLLALYEMGLKTAVVPFEERDEDITVLLGAVPKCIQLMPVLRGM